MQSFCNKDVVWINPPSLHVLILSHEMRGADVVLGLQPPGIWTEQQNPVLGWGTLPGPLV